MKWFSVKVSTQTEREVRERSEEVEEGGERERKGIGRERRERREEKKRKSYREARLMHTLGQVARKKCVENARETEQTRVVPSYLFFVSFRFVVLKIAVPLDFERGGVSLGGAEELEENAGCCLAHYCYL